MSILSVLKQIKCGYQEWDYNEKKIQHPTRQACHPC